MPAPRPGSQRRARATYPPKCTWSSAAIIVAADSRALFGLTLSGRGSRAIEWRGSTLTGHRDWVSVSVGGEPPFAVQGLDSPRLAVPAKRKTALRRPFSKSNLETPLLRGHAFQPGLPDAAAERRVAEAREAEQHHRPGRGLGN
jgi:hypothetical protein